MSNPNSLEHHREQESSGFDSLKEVEFQGGTSSIHKEAVNSPEVQRSKWRKLGSKILGLFSRKPQQVNQVDLPPNDIISSGEPIEPSAVVEDDLSQQERFREATTADERALVDGMERYRYRRKSFLQGEAAQEMREREFNAQFSTLEDLEFASPEDGVSSRTEIYNGKEIPVYDLSGYPFRFLQHAVGYKDVPGQFESAIGLNTARRLFDDPSLWLRSESEIKMEGRPSDQDANTVSTSYIDTEINLASGGVRDNYGVVYGFLSVRPDSFIEFHKGDGATGNNIGKKRPEAIELSFSPDALAKGSTHSYNEVLLRRYDEKGNPMPPDCLIVHNGVITDGAKRHAAYFDVPIINIEDRPYLDKQTKKMAEQIESLNKESSYDEIFRVFQALDQSSLGIFSPWKDDIYHDFGVGKDRVYQERLRSLPESARAKMQELIEIIEPVKRLELLDGELTRVAAELAQTDAKEKYKVDSPFFIARNTRHNRHIGGASYDPATFVDSIDIKYSYKSDSGRPREITTILDSTDAAYEHFSRLVDEYAMSGGSVWDRRIKSV